MSGGSGSADDGRDAAIGQCARCRHALRQRNRRGSQFWRCSAAERDASLLRYPPLPVRDCPAFEAGRPEERCD